MITAQPTSVHNLIPLLFVEDIERSLAFYRDQLGFSIGDKWEPGGRLTWCRLARGGATLMLQQACEEDSPAAGRGRGVGFFFHCDDADAIHVELCANGLLLDPPTVAFYGMKQHFPQRPERLRALFSESGH